MAVLPLRGGGGRASSSSSVSSNRSGWSRMSVSSSSEASASSGRDDAGAGAAPEGAARSRGFGLALMVGLCLVNIFDVEWIGGYEGDGRGGRRSMLSNLYLSGPSTLLPWANHHLVDVTERPDPEKETALFWHIPKSGGTTAKRLYQCMGQTLAHRVGGDPRNGHDKDTELIVFEPHAGKDWKVANVDTTIKPGILRAKKLGLVQSGTTDLIFTMEPEFAGQNLYDEDHRGRFLALFRHPVDRATSMFYYLQTATWERTYRPEWANMTVLEWANLPNGETDYMVHKLVGKSFGEEVTEVDLIIAKELLRQRFIVGLMGEMNESIRRFNIVLGVDEKAERSDQCMREFGLIDEPEPVVEEVEEAAEGDGEKTHATDKKNSNKHPKLEKGTAEYEAVAVRNRLDILLYEYVELLFQEQKEIVDAFMMDVVEPVEQARDETAELALLPAGAAVQVEETNTAEMMTHIANVGEPATNPEAETPFFWHVPKSGGTTLQRLYWCMGSTIANEVGVNPKFGQYEGELSNIVSFKPWKDNPGKVVNVDVCTHDGIVEAKNRGFLATDTKKHPHVDFISTSEFRFASSMLFDQERQTRMFALFRHPIERAVSKFYYLQKATWEPTYNERWAKMSLEEWASRDRGDNNWMVRQLVGKRPGDDLDMEDLNLAKEIISTKFVVGLMDRFEDSVHRFNILLGVDEGDAKNAQCIGEFSNNSGDSHAHRNTDTIVKKNVFNSYQHPEAERGSPVWVSLSKIHLYDNLLYEHVRKVFRQQGPIFGEAITEGEVLMAADS